MQIHPRDLHGAPQVWDLSHPTSVGRSSECAVRVQDDAASRVHATLTPTAAGVRVEDRSRHGTFVDGQRVLTSSMAEAGSVLRCGGTLLLLVRGVGDYDAVPRRLAASFTGLAHDVFAGPVTWRAWQEAMQAAAVRHPVLVLGESGTGKEVIARIIHLSRPNAGKFVAVNLTAIPEGLFEAELFGHVRGAFTGATGTRMGAFREADGGTLFLDEIGDLRADFQVKLLRALESGRIRPLGADGDVTVDPRVVAATSRELDAGNPEGAFRRDLFFRLSGVVIRLAPLRERRDEILMLAKSKLAMDAPGVTLSAAAAESLALRAWPGNIRELHHALVRAALRVAAESGATILPTHLPDAMESTPPGKIELTPDAVRAALARAAGNATAAARLLGVSRATLYNLCARHHLDLAALRAELAVSDGIDHP